jgi:endonuclease G
MDTFNGYNGYDPKFIDPSMPVPLPILNANQQNDLPNVKDADDGIARYVNYSVALSSSRGFPYYSASNIDGTSFKKAPRQDNWREDSRILPHLQWGNELYKAPKSDFDRGHMTKREDVQWGATVLEAEHAADSTFFFPNAIPQHAKLNQRIWKKLEDYVLATETVPNKLRIMVMTGPVLNEKDPDFVTLVKGRQVRLPVLCWKVIIFPKKDGQLHRVGFMMGQKKLLERHGIINPEEEITEAPVTPEDELFMQFSDAGTYQVNISTIEQLTGLTLPAAIDSFSDLRPIQLVLEEVDLNLEAIGSPLMTLGFSIQNLTL